MRQLRRLLRHAPTNVDATLGACSARAASGSLASPLPFQEALALLQRTRRLLLSHTLVQADARTHLRC
jgi:hypothetical protein